MISRTRRSLLLCLVAADAQVFALTRSIAQRITIKRQLETKECTTGYLAVDGIQTCYTLELPDNNNVKYVSRVPFGSYAAHLRYDHPDGWRIELENVRGRDNVQIHVGNWPFQTQGCLLVGMRVAPDSCAVGQSADAYARLRQALYGSANPGGVATLFGLTVDIA